jgi:hypothetical protein
VSSRVELFVTSVGGKITFQRLRENNNNNNNNNNKYFTGEITLHVAQIVNTEQLQHCVP